MSKKYIVVLLVITLLFTLAACGGGGGGTPQGGSSSGGAAPSGSGNSSGGGGSQTTTSEPKYGGLIRIAGGADLNAMVGIPWDLFPAVTQSVPWADSFFLETLGGEYTGALAESWEVDPEKSEVRIKLKEGIFFTDGTPYNAEAAAWNLNTQVASGKLFYSFKGAEVRGEYELAILLEFCWNGFFPTMSTHCYSHISRENYEKNGEDYARMNPHGTGPFTPTEVVPGAYARYERNDSYWRTGKPYLDAVEILYMPDAMARVAAMNSTGADAVDVVSTNLGEQVQQIMDSGAPVNRISWSSGSICIYPSSANADSPFNKLEVRQAIAYAIDREALCDARGFGVLWPADQVIPEGFKGHLSNPNYFSYDPAKAKDLLAQAGYPNGFNSTMHVMTSVDRDIAVAMQKMFEDVGIKMAMEFPESGAAVELRNGGWEGLMCHVFTALSNTVDSYYLQYDIYDQFNVSAWRPPDMEPTYLDARLTEYVEQSWVEKLQKITLDNMTIIPVYFTSTNYLIRKTIHDTGFGIWSTGTVWLPEEAWRED